jgi:hypothetical protein
MKKIFILEFCMMLAFTGCEYNNLANCYHGTIIASNCCSGSTFINLDSSTPIGKNTKFNGKDYPNVIQVPGYLNKGDVYLNLREFDRGKDSNLFPIHCYCLVAVGIDVPVFVALAVSYSTCL